MSPHLEAIAAEPSRSAKLRVAQQHRDSMTQIRDATEQQLRSVLDEDQYARYVALRETFRRDLRETMQARYG